MINLVANISQQRVIGPGGASAPTTQATSITFPSVGSTTLDISWTVGNGSDRIVLMHSGSAVDANPIDDTTYTASTVFGSGTEVGTSNYVVYKGTGNSVTVTGLTAGTTYHVRVYEFNGGLGGEKYLTDTVTGNPNSQATNSLFSALYNFGGAGTDPAVSGSISVWDESKSTTNEDYGVLGSNGVTVIAVNGTAGGPPTLSDANQYWGWKSGNTVKAYSQTLTGTNVLDNNMLNSYWFADSSEAGIRFEDLPNGTYTVEVYSLRTGTATTRTTQVSWNGGSTKDIVANDSDTADVLATKVDLDHYAIFTGIVITDGVLYGLFDPLTTTYCYLNAIQITQTA